MRDMGVRGILIYCTDHRCSHSLEISGDRWPDNVCLPKAEHDAPEWQAAINALMLVAEHGGPTMIARIGIATTRRCTP
jgi:hypothetical protein